MNIELLEKVKSAILAEPQHFRMDTWTCGTAHCIAGWALKLEGVPIVNPEAGAPSQRTANGNEPDIEASSLLDLPHHGLFHVEEWPYELRERYDAAEDFATRAAIAAEAIDDFIQDSDRFGEEADDNFGW